MSSPIITQLLSEKPLVLIVGDSGDLVSSLSQELSKNDSIQVATIAGREFSQTYIINLVNQAYRLIWVCSDVEQIELVKQHSALLSTLGRKLVLIQPVLTVLNDTKSSRPIFSEWIKKSELQKQQILQLNSLFSQAQFIFGLDIVAKNQDLSSLGFLTQGIRDGFLLDLYFNFYFQDTKSFIMRVVELIFRPKSNISYLILGPAQSVQSILGSIEIVLGPNHQPEHITKKIHLESDEPIPFGVEKIISQPLASREIQNFVKAQQNEIEHPNDAWVDKSLIKAGLADGILTSENLDGDVSINEDPGPTSVMVQEEVVGVPLHTNFLYPNWRVDIPPTPIPRMRVPVNEAHEEGFKEGGEFKPDVMVRTRPVRQKEEEPRSSDRTSELKKADFSEELQKIFQKNRITQRVDRISKQAVTRVKINKKSKRKKILFGGGVVFLGIGLAILTLAGVFLTTESMLIRQTKNIMEQIVSGQESNDRSWKNLTTMSRILSFQADIYQSLFDHPRFVKSQLLVEVGESMVAAEKDIALFDQTLVLLVLQLLGREIGDIQLLSENASTQGLRAYENLSRIQANLKQLDLGVKADVGEAEVGGEAVSKNASEGPLLYEEVLLKLRKSLTIFQQLEPLLTDLSGVNDKRIYAVVLQNEQELRPTGGFIQAVALLSFSGGGLVSQQVYSSYALDAKLLGEIEPPEEIKTYLGEDRWYFRDSNWNPNFPSSGERMAWFIEKSTGQKIDGVIALNLSVVERVIEELGPLDVPEFNEVLTSKNIYERFEFHSDIALVNPQEHLDYSTLVLERLLHKVVLQPEDKIFSTLNALESAVSSHQLLVYLANAPEQDTFLAMGWAGSLTKPGCPTQLQSPDCVVEMIAQVEANIGVNKANFYIERNQEHVVEINKDVARHTRKINLKNTAKSNSWPKGPYSAFVRVYLSGNPDLESVKINGRTLQIEDVPIRKDDDLTLFGFTIEVPIQQEAEIELVYNTNLLGKDRFTYALFNQKQAGTLGSPVEIRIIPSPDLEIMAVAPLAEIDSTGALFKDLSQSHAFVGVRF